MKVFKYILIGFFVLVILAIVGLYVFIKTFDINRYRPQIIAAASQALKRPVEIKNIKLKLSLQDGVVLDVEGLTIADLAQFQSTALLKVDAIQVGVDVQVYLKNKTIRVTNVRVLSPQVTIIRTKEGQINLQSLVPQSSPTIEMSASQTPPPVSASPAAALPVDINSLTIDAIRVTDGQVLVLDKSFSPEISLTANKIDITAEKFSLIQPFSFKIKAAVLSSAQNVSIDGEAQLGTQEFSLTGQMEALDLAQLPNQKDLPVKIEGQLFGQFTAKGQGFAPDALISSLQGEGTVNVKNGKLVDINVLKTVLSKMSMLPNLVDTIEANLPERYKEILNNKDTPLKKVEITTAILAGNIKLDKAEVEADGFSIVGNGTVDFAQNLNLNSSLVVEKDLSSSMLAAVKELQYIANENGQIQIPVRVSGKATAPVILPDMEYLGKRIIANRGKEEINKVLDKVFGGKESSSDNPQEERPERKAIQSILDSILK